MRATIHRRLMRLRLLLLARDTRGVAAVEFALILPFLLLLFVGSIEASSLITVDRRVNIISGSVGDLVARWDGSDGNLPSNSLKDYFKAAEAIVYPYGKTPLKQSVTLIEVSAAGVTKVKWSCAWNGGTTHTVNNAYSALPAKMNELARGKWVVASETWYSYKPVLGIVYTSALSLYSQSFYLPRFENEIVVGTCPT